MKDYIDNTTLYFIDRVLYIATIYVCSFILYKNFKNIKLNKNTIAYFIFLSIIVPTLSQLLGGFDSLPIKTLFLFLMIISLMLLDYKQSSFTSIPIAIIATAISLCTQYVCVLLSAILFYFIVSIKTKLIVTIVICIIHLLLCLGISKIKALRRCFFYLTSETRYGFGLLISCYIFSFSFLITQASSLNMFWRIMLLIICPLALTALILWIRSIVNNYFKRKIADRADAFTQQEIKEKDERIEQLEAEVATLAKQMHRDNHLLSSLDRSVRTLAETESAAEREQLADEFRTLYRERNDLIAKEQQERKLLPSTGVALIDGALSEMYVKATAHGIHFDLMVGEPIHYLVNNIISQTDLQTLLCDHIKDAIIAVDAAKGESGNILVSIEKHEGLFEITIRDNGVDFTPDTLAKLGQERVTTHAEEGGSGIGFMTTFETLEKTKGSLIITEHESKTPFSKSVAFVFDGLHQFIISSYRKDELKEKLSRDDILYL